MIAFGLATNTSLLILDEPTNGLDIPSKVQFRKLIASGLDEKRCVIISTHQVRDLDSLIDTILILDNHRIVVNQPMDELTEKLLQSGKYPKMDLELFFNAATTDGGQLLALLVKGGGHE
jgi:ABC-2 type transport system ATP-binding protein